MILIDRPLSCYLLDLLCSAYRDSGCQKMTSGTVSDSLQLYRGFLIDVAGIDYESHEEHDLVYRLNVEGEVTLDSLCF